jgi:hypothetical protein
MISKRPLAALLVLILLSGILFANEGVGPATGTRFAVPLSDGSQGVGLLLPGPAGSFNLVIATPSGSLIVLPVGTENTPPTPPAPPVKRSAFVIIDNPATATVAQRAVLADPRWRTATLADGRFGGLIPFGYVDPNTGKAPERFAAALAEATGKRCPLIVWISPDGTATGSTPMPETLSAFLSLLSLETGYPTHAAPD